MWHTIQAYHDLPTPSGYFPHQIPFGSDGIQQGLLWATPVKAHDCEEFMAYAEEMVAKVTEALTREHEKRRHYPKKATVAKHNVRDGVRRDRPSKLSEHRQATYYIPAEVHKRLGEDTYTLKVGQRLFRDRHHTQMKPHVPDPRSKRVRFNYTNLEVDEATRSGTGMSTTRQRSWGTAQPLRYLGSTSSRRNGKVSGERTIR